MLNFKGGVGKSTAAVNLAAALTQLKKSVLLIDLDQQCTSSTTFSKSSPFYGETIYEFLTGKTESAFAYETQNKKLDYVPSSRDMRFVETDLSRKREREHILSKFVSQVSDSYDYIIFDCPPGEGVVTDNALVASNYVLIPVKCDEFSLYGLRDIMTEIDDIKKESNPALSILGIFVNIYDVRNSIEPAIADQLKASFADYMLSTKIRINVALKEFPSTNQSIFEYNNKSHGAEDYLNLGKEVIKKTRNIESKK